MLAAMWGHENIIDFVFNSKNFNSFDNKCEYIFSDELISLLLNEKDVDGFDCFGLAKHFKRGGCVDGILRGRKVEDLNEEFILKSSSLDKNNCQMVGGGVVVPVPDLDSSSDSL